MMRTPEKFNNLLINFIFSVLVIISGMQSSNIQHVDDEKIFISDNIFDFPRSKSSAYQGDEYEFEKVKKNQRKSQVNQNYYPNLEKDFYSFISNIKPIKY